MNKDIQPIPAMPLSLDTVRILVVGDVMLDRYWFGDVSRISPEAPVDRDSSNSPACWSKLNSNFGAV